MWERINFFNQKPFLTNNVIAYKSQWISLYNFTSHWLFSFIWKYVSLCKFNWMFPVVFRLYDVRKGCGSALYFHIKLLWSKHKVFIVVFVSMSLMDVFSLLHLDSIKQKWKRPLSQVTGQVPGELRSRLSASFWTCVYAGLGGMKMCVYQPVEILLYHFHVHS